MRKRRFRRRSIRATATLLVAGLAFTTVPAAVGDGAVVGEIRIREGYLPEPARVRAIPVEGGTSRTAPVEEGATFAFEGLPPGLYRFEVLLANNTVFAAAGAVETRIEPGLNRLTLVVARGRVEPEPRRFSEWPTRYQVLAIIGGIGGAALICAAADCGGDDDEEENVSPSAP
jgi:hypothetical protein